ncbi:MAG: hypothetical protein FWC84_06600 [Alphaproteobacteria bacterium]|nr:hypothetical protein [Alphaproteobacteria bacterium]
MAFLSEKYQFSWPWKVRQVPPVRNIAWKTRKDICKIEHKHSRLKRYYLTGQINIPNLCLISAAHFHSNRIELAGSDSNQSRATVQKGSISLTETRSVMTTRPATFSEERAGTRSN